MRLVRWVQFIFEVRPSESPISCENGRTSPFRIDEMFRATGAITLKYHHFVRHRPQGHSVLFARIFMAVQQMPAIEIAFFERPR